VPQERRDLEQIKFLLGHSSIQTSGRYLGSEQDIGIVVNDNVGLVVMREKDGHHSTHAA